MEWIVDFLTVIWSQTGAVFLDPGHFFGPTAMIFALAIAAFVVAWRLARKSGWRNLNLRRVAALLFPKRVFLHGSAKLDYAVFTINQIVLFFVAFSALFSPAIVSELIVGGASLLGYVPGSELPSLTQRILYSIYLMLVWDFSASYAHYLKHKVPVLWELHKVHHSAEVMTPVTAMRRHPLEAIFGAVIVAMFLGLATAVWTLVFGQMLMPINFFGTLFGIWLWRALGYNLRHSHIWISYGNFWNQIFISPAQHQVHHSVSPAHYDKNFGHIFAFWDRLFGTLYLPQHEERVKFGIEPGEQHEYRSLLGLYVTPCVKSWRILTRPLRRPRYPAE
jgi:sterol desaturase/sphingolipid hydroxylase (fatty acid hydroxylase superfamily)